jgi:large subunit ribosomal protein L22
VKVKMMYSFKPDDESKVAKARLEGVDASFKDLAQVCGTIRTKPIGKAVALLLKAKTGEMPILYKSHNKHLGHRHELGGQKGRYPIKSVAIVLKVLNSAIANARAKNLAEDRLVVVHACANRKMVFGRLQPKGLRKRHDYETARVEIILAESAVREPGTSHKEAQKPEPKAAKQGRTQEPAKAGKAKAAVEPNKDGKAPAKG